MGPEPLPKIVISSGNCAMRRVAQLAQTAPAVSQPTCPCVIAARGAGMGAEQKPEQGWASPLMSKT